MRTFAVHFFGEDGLRFVVRRGFFQSRNFAKLLYVRKVLVPSHCQFVFDQLLPRNDMRWRVIVKQAFYPILPSFIKTNSRNALQDIDASGWNTHLKHGGGLVVEIGRGHSGEGCAIFRQCGKDCFAIFLVGLDKNIEIFCASRLGMKTYGVSTDNEIFHAVSVQGCKDVLVILKHPLPLSYRAYAAAFQSGNSIRRSVLSEGNASTSMPLAR